MRWPAPLACPPPAWRRVHAVLCDWAGTARDFPADDELRSASIGAPAGNVEDAAECGSRSCPGDGRLRGVPVLLLAVAPGKSFRLASGNLKAGEDGSSTGALGPEPPSSFPILMQFRRLADMKGLGTCELRSASAEPRICVTRHGALVISSPDDRGEEAKGPGRNEGMDATMPLHQEGHDAVLCCHPEVRLNFVSDAESDSPFAEQSNYGALSEQNQAPMSNLLCNQCDGWLLVEFYVSSTVPQVTNCGVSLTSQPKTGDHTDNLPALSEQHIGSSSFESARARFEDLVGWARLVRCMLGLQNGNDEDLGTPLELKELLQQFLSPSVRAADVHQNRQVAYSPSLSHLASKSYRKLDYCAALSPFSRVLAWLSLSEKA